MFRISAFLISVFVLGGWLGATKPKALNPEVFARTDLTTTLAEGIDRELRPIVSIQNGELQLIFFGATWCHVCQKQSSILEELNSKLTRYQLHITGVAILDTEENFRAHAAEHPKPVYSLFDRDNTISKLLNISSVPNVAIWNKRNGILKIFNGLISTEMLIHQLDTLTSAPQQ